MDFHGPYVVTRSMQDPTKQLPCLRCTMTRGVKNSVHRERGRLDREGNLHEIFTECDHCGRRIAGPM